MYPPSTTASSGSSPSLDVTGNVSEQEKKRALDALNDIVAQGTFGAEFGRKLRLVSVDEETEHAEDGRFRALSAKMVIDFDVDTCRLIL